MKMTVLMMKEYFVNLHKDYYTMDALETLLEEETIVIRLSNSVLVATF